MNKNFLTDLKKQLEGHLHLDNLTKSIYATDASVYRKTPAAVAFPKNEDDLKKLIVFADENGVGLIPRTAGTSLAGQCVGDGIVVDVSKNFTQILDFNKDLKQITVQPGVIRDELNQFLAPHGLFFGPNTSTANRCMIGGMVGNNSSGTTSIQYGVTRDKVIALKTLLADGSEATFAALSPERYKEKISMKNLEGNIYREVYNELSNKDVGQNIRTEFPKQSIHRRNTGYAVDALLESTIFSDTDIPFNFCKLLSGSEGTLAFTTEITLQLDDLPPPHAAMVVTHYRQLQDCLSDVAVVMQHNLHLCEMMDKVILDCTKNNRMQLANRFFVDGDPAALLMLEIKAETEEDLEEQLALLNATIKRSGLSYAQPVLKGDDINKAIELRKAGLGLLGNMVGDRKAVACIEDTAVALEDLSNFIGEFTKIMKSHGQEAVYYAHAGAGELHLRPILNLKKSEDVSLFRTITTEVAHLTKKYKGSFSGEHGDGIVRAEFIPLMIGHENYDLLKRLKSCFDPKNIFNPGKIVDAYPMDESLRYEIDREEPNISTFMDFSDSEGILKAAEKCNGSGDCRKTEKMAGAMCPSYHATRSEKDTTRGRANALREYLTGGGQQKNPFDQPDLKEVFDLCLSCKACSTECPSNVDIATLKSEFQYQYQEANGYPIRSKIFAHATRLNKLGSKLPGLTNAVYSSKFLGGIIKKLSGVAKQRALPKVASFNFNKYLNNIRDKYGPGEHKLILYIDEFTNYLDVELGKDAILLLTKLGYDVRLFYGESGRTYISKGFLKQAKRLAERNADKIREFIDQGLPIVGLEPSAILTFRDEYLRFGIESELIDKIGSQVYLIEEYLAREIKEERIGSDHFDETARTIKIHNHCHQKALSDQKVTFDILNLPVNHNVTIISSGCCGMAGSFGYEKEHYEISMKIGELKLFPAIRKSDEQVLISANGTSCRHQIFDGTGKTAKHPVTILKEALLIN
ncbi:FAD-binding and (Fe-S)-binding domain-containing protein [Muriicola sp. Z0-33]|uniref:FAD-binding and (Fe-S)-binding domain-containing protein n=1 Tax=Muriicola sp. Z0-33 TaxID=2816957 RepID=UPI00223881F9|nr:FAD-binding and (Fe-S)-binding domain-containing protein [Muriicola sp. Z0-33]MCW5515343.1 FAD-binding protein [Muriicola sp. Z0-33]